MVNSRVGLGILVSSLILLTGCQMDLYGIMMKLSRWSAGVTIREVSADHFDLVYATRGQGTPIFLIHGFGSEKDDWNGLLRTWSAKHRFIVPDLPGFGQSRLKGEGRYGIREQVQRLDWLRSHLGLERIHIIGTSMGGAIAGVYAATYPEHVLSVSLLTAAGLKIPVKSDLQKALAEGQNPLIVSQEDDVQRLVDYVMYKPVKVPEFYRKGLLRRNEGRADRYRNIFTQIVEEGAVLEQALPKIRAPLLVLWGREDRILPVEGTDIIRRLKPDASIHILPECGHLITFDQSSQTRDLLDAFILEHTPKGP